MPAPERTISVGRHSLRVPALFASYRLGDHPTSGLKKFPWTMTRTEAVLINAYDFTQRKYQAWLNNGWDPAAAGYLNFGDKPLMIDSGAYYFLRDDSISVTAEDVLSIQLKAKADVGVTLDHPFPPDAKDKAKRIARTIRNTESALQILSGKHRKMTLLPVIHGHTRRSILGCIHRLRRLAEQYDQPILEHVGIGSLAPLAKSGNVQLAVDVIHTVRRELPDSQIHCFSMGSALLMLLAFYSGADSVDSQTWMVSAGFKLAQLPGHYVLRMGKREYSSIQKFNGAMCRFANRLARLADEEDFAAKDWQTGTLLNLKDAVVRRQYVADLVDLSSNENVHNRACHNLWVYNFEVRSYREAACRGRLDHFIASRLRGTRYEPAFAHAKRLQTE
jgi:queuine/archaeosine tRNA-ribosyltransferase